MAGIDGKRAFRALPRPGDVKLSLVRTDHDGWLLLDGRRLTPASHPRLFEAIGAAYGGDGRSTFALPNARDAFLVVAGAARALGSIGGTESHALTADELPEHDHAYSRTGRSTKALQVGAGVLPLSIVSEVTSTDAATGKTGMGKAFSLIPPYFALNAFVYAGL
ncbi:MAG: tail fiber protein [Methylorubrum rhodinum]|uniref:phage tail protein n=1 Tax=Methylorubrum rhodinum TaxID=29428 RepID=UPI003BB1245A